MQRARSVLSDAHQANVDTQERMRRETDVQMARMRHSHALEQEGIKRDYEILIEKIRHEYTLCNDTLRKATDAQSGEIQELGQQIVSLNERHRLEKQELDE